MVGCGDGEVVSVEETPIKKAVAGQVVFPTQVGDPTKPNLIQKKSEKFSGAITSLLLSPSGTDMLVSTNSCQVYRMTILTFSHSQILSCPSKPLLCASLSPEPETIEDPAPKLNSGLFNFENLCSSRSMPWF